MLKKLKIMLIFTYFIKHNYSMSVLFSSSSLNNLLFINKQNTFWKNHIILKKFQNNLYYGSSFFNFFLNCFEKKFTAYQLLSSYTKIIELDSDNDFYDLFYLHDWFKFFLKNNTTALNNKYNVKIYKLNSFDKISKLIFHVILLYNIFKKNKSLYIRPKLFTTWFVNLIVSLKNVRLKRKRAYKKLRLRKSALTFFQKKYFYSFIRFKRRFFKNIKKKKYKKKFKLKIRSKSYKTLLNDFKKKVRFNFNSLILLKLKKKLFLSKTAVDTQTIKYKNSLNNYNLNLMLFDRFNKEKQYFIFKNLNIFKNTFFPKLFIFFISLFFEQLTKKKTLIKLYTNTKMSIFEVYWVNYFSKKYIFIQKQFKGVLHLNEFIYILLLTFKYKDLFFLKNWLVNFLEKINLKKHKAFLRVFKRISLSLLNTSAKLLNIKGFLFDIRGKVGVAGNAKKRHSSIKYKCYGFTKIQLKAEQVKFTIRTNTGVLGATLIITY